jgi:transcriptional regulator with XRE-family HTH domain
MVSQRAKRDHFSMANKNKLAVPTYLAQWRTFRRLTQEQLAERAGLSPPSISQLENSKQGFSDESLANFAKALHCDPVDLLAHDPTVADSFWPLFRAAERLKGRDRQRVYAIIKATLDPYSGG